MKNMGKYILIGIGVVIIEWIFLAFFSEVFNGLSQEDAIVTGAAFFLAFEMVICTGAILSKLEKNDK
ncbi:MAG: hypothetical protein IJZ23_02485 [Roseburia sp.]|nr:hypothetical protein [Roseburia sp.]